MADEVEDLSCRKASSLLSLACERPLDATEIGRASCRERV